MRKYIGFFSAVAAAAIALVSCQKEIVEVEQNRHSVSFQALMTKTELGLLDGTTRYINWTGSENIFFYENNQCVSGTDVAIYVNESDKNIASFTAIFEDQDGPYTYKAIVANELSGDQAILSDEQTPSVESYDPRGDIMFSDKVSRSSNLVTEDQDFEKLFLNFSRPVVINKMTLTGLEAGEKVQEVVFTAAADLAGSIATSYDADGVVSNFSYTGTSKTITVKYANDEAAASDGTFPVYFTSFPAAEGIGAFKVTVTTDKGGYRKTANGASLKFEVGKMTKFKFGLADAERSVYRWVKVTAGLEDWSGKYIVANSSDKVISSYESNNFKLSSDAVVVENNVVTDAERIAKGAYVFEFTKSGNTSNYSIVTTHNNQRWDVGYNSNSSTSTNFNIKLENSSSTLSDGAYLWTLSYNAGKVSIYNVSETKRYWGLEGDAYKVYAATGHESPYLYRLSLVDDVCITPVITISDSGIASITCSTDGASIYYTVGDNPVAPTNSDALYSNPIQLTAGQSIKAIAYKTGMKASEVASATYSVVEPFEYVNGGNVGTSGGIKAEGNVNTTASNGNPGNSFANTSSSNKTFTFSGFNLSAYSTRTLSLDVKWASYPSTTNVYPKLEIEFYKGNTSVRSEQVTVSSKITTYNTYKFEGLPDFDKIVMTSVPSTGKTGKGAATTIYSMYMDNITVKAK